MATKPICFDHEGKQVQAEVYYDFDRLSDAVLISTADPENELDSIIFFGIADKKWVTRSPFKTKFPSTIKSIVHCINEYFEMDEKGHFHAK
jgi:hypothetical protein